MIHVASTFLALLVTAGSGLAASSNKSEQRRVVVEYTDLTGTQPMSSAPWVAHARGYHLWEVGKPASVAVEELAETGNPEFILGEALTDHDTFGDFAVGLPDVPGSSRTVELNVDAAHPLVSGAWMLVATNDGFAGVDGIDAFALDGPTTLDVYALDAGTEKNTESKADAIGGLGHVPENGVVHRHEGIRGDADIATSFRFDPEKPVGRVVVRLLKSAKDPQMSSQPGGLRGADCR